MTDLDRLAQRVARLNEMVRSMDTEFRQSDEYINLAIRVADLTLADWPHLQGEASPELEEAVNEWRKERGD